MSIDDLVRTAAPAMPEPPGHHEESGAGNVLVAILESSDPLE
jgi:hypothetical protein